MICSDTECPGSYPECPSVHINFCCSVSTAASIKACADASHVTLRDFFIDSAWLRVQEQNKQAAPNVVKCVCFSSKQQNAKD